LVSHKFVQFKKIAEILNVVVLKMITCTCGALLCIKPNKYIIFLSSAPPKIQRVIAPRRPTDIITTSSWRTGQQTVKRILGPAKKTSSSVTGRPQSSSSQDTNVPEPRSLNYQWKDEDDDMNGVELMNGDAAVRDGSKKVEAPREKSPIHEEHVNGLNSGEMAS